MFESLGKTLAALIEERFTNPLISSYAISWAIYNWKFWVILFSNNTSTRTFQLVDEIYKGGWMHWLAEGFGVPAAITAVYLFFLPKYMRKVYSVWRENQFQYEQIRDRYDDEQKIPAGTLRELREKFNDLQRTSDIRQESIDKLTGELKAAEAKATAAVTQESLASKQLLTQQTEYDQLRASFAKLAKALGSGNNSLNSIDAEGGHYKPSPYPGLDENLVHGAVESGRTPIFITPPIASINEALSAGRDLKRKVFVIIYDGKLNPTETVVHNVGNFLKYMDTKKFIDAKFVTCLTTMDDPAAKLYLDADTLMEKPYLLVFDEQVKVQWRTPVIANPEEGTDQVKAINEGISRIEKLRKRLSPD